MLAEGYCLDYACFWVYDNFMRWLWFICQKGTDSAFFGGCFRLEI